MREQRPFFSDRSQAGRLLADRLARRGLKDVIVYALPRGGVPVAFEIAQTLHSPLDLSLVRKIGAPGQPELALAAVVPDQAHGVLAGDAAVLHQPFEHFLELELAVHGSRRRRGVGLRGGGQVGDGCHGGKL